MLRRLLFEGLQAIRELLTALSSVSPAIQGLLSAVSLSLSAIYDLLIYLTNNPFL